MDHIDLVARRDQESGALDFHIYAGEQRVGRIYQYHKISTSETWWWGLNTICIDATFPPPMKGYTHTFEEARAAFRSAFDRWLIWAGAVPKWDLKRAHIDENLRKIGAD